MGFFWSGFRQWQYLATQLVKHCFIAGTVWPRLPDSSRAMLRSLSGPHGSVPFTCCPVARHTTFDAQVLRTLLLRRLWLPVLVQLCLPVWPSTRFQWPPPTGVLGSRGFAVESAAARVCREAGGRDTTNTRIHRANQLDEPRIEVLADGLPCRHNAGLGVAAGWSPSPPLRRRRWRCSGAARRRKELRYPELWPTGQNATCCLGSRSGRKVVSGDCTLSLALGQSQGLKVVRVSAQCA